MCRNQLSKTHGILLPLMTSDETVADYSLMTSDETVADYSLMTSDQTIADYSCLRCVPVQRGPGPLCVAGDAGPSAAGSQGQTQAAGTAR